MWLNSSPRINIKTNYSRMRWNGRGKKSRVASPEPNHHSLFLAYRWAAVSLFSCSIYFIYVDLAHIFFFFFVAINRLLLRIQKAANVARFESIWWNRRQSRTKKEEEEKSNKWKICYSIYIWMIKYKNLIWMKFAFDLEFAFVVLIEWKEEEEVEKRRKEQFSRYFYCMP